jgi:hypothetical protein
MKTEPQRPIRNRPQSNLRAEKLSALEALLGRDAMDRLRRHDDGFAIADDAKTATDTDRVAWQRNRLIERLRTRWPERNGADQPHSTRGKSGSSDGSAQDASGGVDSRIASAIDLSSLADEHPAVIVRVLEKMEREKRVKVLRALPGPIARGAIRRLRSSK